MTSFLLFGGWLFWSVVLIFIISCTATIEDSRGRTEPFWPSVLTIVLGLALYFMIPDFKGWVNNLDIKGVLLWAGVYVLSGLIWSFIRWIKFVRKAARETRSSVSGYTNAEEVFLQRIPKAKDNKADITTWIVFWPFSMLRFFIGDVLHKFFSHLIDLFNGVYNKITEKAYKY